MRKSLLKPYAFLSIFLIFFLQSCRKGDRPLINPSDNNEHLVKKFLTAPANSSKYLKDLIEGIAKLEKKSPFLSDVIQQNGTPFWEETISSISIIQEASTINAFHEASLQDTALPGVCFIPLGDENTKQVNAYIFCAKIGDTGYLYKLYNRREILATLPKTKDELNNGILELSVFAAFDNKLQGKKDSDNPYPFGYKIKDSKIKFKKFSPKHKATVTGLSVKSSGLTKKTFDEDGCEEIKKLALSLIDINFVIEYVHNKCTGQTQVLSISWPNGDLVSLIGGYFGWSGGSGGSGGNSGGTNSGGSNNNGTIISGGNGGYYYGNYYDPYAGIATGSNAPSYWTSSGLGDPFLAGSPTSPGMPGENQELPSDAPSLAPVVQSLQNEIGLDMLEANYLNEQLPVALELADELQWEDDEDGTLGAAREAAKMAIDMEMYNMADGPFDQTFFTMVVPRDGIMKFITDQFINLLRPVVKYSNSYYSNYNLYRKLNPTKSKIVIGWKALKAVVQDEIPNIQNGLDKISLWPGPIGGFADITNSAIYLFNGDYREAGNRFHMALQSVTLGNLGNWAQSGEKLILKNEDIMVKLENTEVRFYRDQKSARSKLGLQPKDGYIAHHVLPFGLGNHIIVQKAAEAGFHINDLDNLHKIEALLHKGPHTNYTTQVNAALDGILFRYTTNIDPEDALKEVRLLINRITEKIRQNPGVNINNISF